MARKLGALADDDKKVVPLNPVKEEAMQTAGNVTQATFLEAVRDINDINGKVAALNEERKRRRKKWKANGIELGILDLTLKMADWERPEIRERFDLERRYAHWLGLPLESQPDMFKGLDDDAVQRKEWRATGRTFSRMGRPGRPPDHCPEEFIQDFMAGFNEQDEAEWDQAENAEAGPAPAVAKPKGKKGGAPETIPADQVDAIAEHLQAEDSAGADEIPGETAAPQDGPKGETIN